MVLIDTNVLLDLFTADETWGEWSGFQLRAQSQVHRLAINPIIYAEISLTFDSVSILDDTLKTLQVEMQEIPDPHFFLQPARMSITGARAVSKEKYSPIFWSARMQPSPT